MIYVLGLLGFTLAFLLPGHYFPWTSFQQEAAAAAGAALCALGVAVTSKTWPVRAPVPALALALLAVVPLAQWLLGNIAYRADAVLPALYLVGAALTVVTALELFRLHGQRFLEATFGAVLAAALASVGIGIAQWLDISPNFPIELISRGDRVSANLHQPNHLASLLGIGLIGVIWLYERRRLGGFVTAFVAAYLAFGLLLTQSRTAWLFLLLTAALFWYASRGRVQFRLTPSNVVVFVALFAMGAIGWGHVSDVVQSGLSTQGFTQRAQAGPRLIIWTVMADAAMHMPLFGYGWMQTPAAQLNVALNHPPVMHWLSSSHNLALDILLWNGWPVGLLAIGGTTIWAVTRIRSCHTIDSWAAIAALTVLAAHSMVELPMHFAYFVLLAALFVGVVEAGHASSGRPVVAMGRAAYVGASMAVTLVLVAVCGEYLQVEEQERRATLKAAGYVADGAPPAVPDVVILDGLREFIRLQLAVAREGMSGDEIEQMRMVVSRYPVPPALMRYAIAAALNGRVQEAERALALICLTAKPDNCQLGRESWKNLSLNSAKVALVPYPDVQRR